MPELPEVEVTRRSFVEQIRQATILEVRLGKPLRWPLGCSPLDLPGRQVLDVDRRGKYLLIHLDQGFLLLHLGMSGSLLFRSDDGQPGPHDHFDLVTDRGVLRLHDPRRFGAVVYATGLGAPPAAKLLGRLGMEPLSDAFDLPAFGVALRQRQAPIKQVLMAGDVVVGLGNIYASEALFLAGIRPAMRASRLRGRRVRSLHAAIRSVLETAVQRGGSTLRDFSSADGQAGHFQLEAMVYARAGLPCKCCGIPIKKITLGQRSTFYCPGCQKS